MPFDSTETDATLALTRFRETPTLGDLAIILRHREVWPEGFVWDFGECEHCAMGLAACALRDDPATHERCYFDWVAAVFDIDMDTVDQLFDEGPSKGKVANYVYVTPEHVAAAIEEYLSTHA